MVHMSAIPQDTWLSIKHASNHSRFPKMVINCISLGGVLCTKGLANPISCEKGLSLVFIIWSVDGPVFVIIS